MNCAGKFSVAGINFWERLIHETSTSTTEKISARFFIKTEQRPSHNIFTFPPTKRQNQQNKASLSICFVLIVLVARNVYKY